MYAVDRDKQNLSRSPQAVIDDDIVIVAAASALISNLFQMFAVNGPFIKF